MTAHDSLELEDAEGALGVDEDLERAVFIRVLQKYITGDDGQLSPADLVRAIQQFIRKVQNDYVVADICLQLGLDPPKTTRVGDPREPFEPDALPEDVDRRSFVLTQIAIYLAFLEDDDLKMVVTLAQNMRGLGKRRGRPKNENDWRIMAALDVAEYGRILGISRAKAAEKWAETNSWSSEKLDSLLEYLNRSRRKK